MAQVINTNVASLNAQRNLNSSQNDLQTSLQRLSSGLRINSAKDDAAGLAISERFTTQIRGLNQAARNASDGISLAQTGEGDLAQVTNNLQRIRELAVQSANATNSSSDRAALQLETAELIAEIERVASTSAFNGVNLLDGSFSSQLFQVGANSGETVSIDNISSARTSEIGQVWTATANGGDTPTQITAAGLTAGDLLINGNDVGTVDADALEIANAISATDSNVTATATNARSNIDFADVTVSAATPDIASVYTSDNAFTLADFSGTPLIFDVTGIDGTSTDTVTLSSDYTALGITIDDVINDINTALATSGVTADVNADGELIFTSDTAGAGAAEVDVSWTSGGTQNEIDGAVTTTGADAVAAQTYTLSIDGTAVDLTTAGANGTITAEELATAISSISGYTATIGDTATQIDITKDDGSNFRLVEAGTQAATEGFTTADTTYRGSVEVTSTGEDPLVITGNAPASAGLTADAYASSLGGTTIANTDISTVAGANAAIASVDSALTSINTSRASLGAIQNRFESIVASIETSVENLSSARSRIRDADFAAETAALTRNQILQQAGVSILSQANALPQLALSLLQ